MVQEKRSLSETEWGLNQGSEQVSGRGPWPSRGVRTDPADNSKAELTQGNQLFVV